MKLLVSNAYLSFLPENKVAVSFIANDRYITTKFVDSLKHIDKIELTAKEHKSSRTLQQNNLLWAIISAISDKLNSEHSHSSTLKIYGDLLLEANVKRYQVALLPEAVEPLRSRVRALIPTYQEQQLINYETGEVAMGHGYWVYEGSSTFNTKELNELLEIAKNYAYKLGIEWEIL